MNLQQAIKEIALPNKKRLPKEALIWAKDNWTEFSSTIVPLFDKVTNQQKLTDEEAELVFFGVYLLTEVKDYSRADLFFSMVDQNDDCGSYLESVFGDAITGNFSTFFYILSNGEQKLIQNLLISHKAGTYIKCTALNALFALYETGKISTTAIDEIIPKAIIQAVFLNQTSFLGDLCHSLIRYGFPQYHAEFKNLLADNKLDEMYVNPSDVTNWMLKKQYETELERGIIKSDFNTIDELSTWAGFQEKETKTISSHDIYSNTLDEYSIPYVADIKIGRNDPCPCGSGKKYKKCCM